MSTENITSEVVFEMLEKFGCPSWELVAEALGLLPDKLARMRGTKEKKSIKGQWVNIDGTRKWPYSGELKQFKEEQLSEDNKILAEKHGFSKQDSFNDTLRVYFDACLDWSQNGDFSKVSNHIGKILKDYEVEDSYLNDLLKEQKHKEFIAEIIRIAGDNAKAYKRNKAKKADDSTPQSTFTLTIPETLTLRSVKNILTNRGLIPAADDEVFLEDLFPKSYFPVVYSDIQGAMNGTLSDEEKSNLLRRYNDQHDVAQLELELGNHIRGLTQLYSTGRLKAIVDEIIATCPEETREWLNNTYLTKKDSGNSSSAIGFLLMVCLVTPDFAYQYSN